MKVDIQVHKRTPPKKLRKLGFKTEYLVGQRLFPTKQKAESYRKHLKKRVERY